MKILFIQKFFYLHGGGSRYFFELSRLMKKHGHEVAFFAMDHKNNKKSVWDKYFVSEVGYKEGSIIKNIKLFFRSLYSLEARNKISILLDDFKPDIVQLFDIYHHISPSIIPEIRKRNIPIIARCGDYHNISPNYSLYHNGKICEVTKQKSFYKAIFHKCVKSSYFASLGEVFEKYLHDVMRYYDLIDYFIIPSIFMKNKFVEYGTDPKKLIYLPIFIDSENYIPDYNLGEYILYFGRLSPEKGIDVLLSAMQKLNKIPLKIVGIGSEEVKLKMMVQKMGLTNIEFLGFLDGRRLKQVIADSRFTVLPSVWYENSPNCVLESYASGKPVVASRIGGITELISHGYTGLLFNPGNTLDCQNKIISLWNNPDLCIRMGVNARKQVENKYNPGIHYDKIISIYNKVFAEII
jgi:glycosyltransferase involved in cell wall biosynthesis